jgi:hypothetical protein
MYKIDIVIITLCCITFFSAIVLDWQFGINCPMMTRCDYMFDDTIKEKVCILGCKIRQAVGLDMKYYVDRANDLAVKNNPPYFRYLNGASTFVLLPLGIVAVYGLIKRKEWRIPGILFAALHLDHASLYLFDVFSQISKPTDPKLIIGANSLWMILPALMFWRYYKTPLFPAGYNRAIGTRFNSIPSIVTNGKSSTSADLDEITSKSPRLKTPSRAKPPKSSKKSKDKSKDQDKSEDSAGDDSFSPVKEKKSPAKIGGDAIAALAKIMKDGPLKKKKK